MSIAPAEVPHVPPSSVPEIVQSLAGPRQEIEAAFLNVGDLLSRSAGLLDQIGSTFETLPRDLDRPEVNEATARLTEVGSKAQEISDSFAQEQQDILRLVDVVAKANRPITELRKTIRMMGILSVNARVVAATVPNLEDSDVFTTDIATLSSSAAKTIAAFTAIYEKLGQEVQAAAAARDKFEQSQSGTLSGLATRIGTSLDAVTRQRKRSSDGSAETVQMSRAIGQRVMTAVMALQVGDATRQRVEHIETGLRKASEMAPNVLSVVAELSAAQLFDTIATLDNDVAEAEQALGQLARDATTISARSREIYGSGGQDSSALSRLNQEMRHATAVLHDCERERKQLGTVAAEVENTVKVLLEHVAAVQAIEANMRLVSLNAAIKCAQLGPEGAALNVIARQLRSLTTDTVKAAEAAAERLGEAAELALAFSAASGDEATQQMEQLELDAADGLKLMESVEVRIRDALLVLEDAAPQVARYLDGASGGFSNHQDISETLSDAQMQLVALGAGSVQKPEPGSEMAALLEEIRKTYTMESERQIHDRMFGKPAAAAAPVLVSVNDGDGLDTFEDFDSIAGPITAEDTKAANDEPLGVVEDDVLLF